MRYARQSTSRKAHKVPPMHAFSAICSCCEATGNTLSPHLPAGWATETINGNTSAYCPDCAIDLPKGAIQ